MEMNHTKRNQHIHGMRYTIVQEKNKIGAYGFEFQHTRESSSDDKFDL
jgi:hypothetical protein